MESIWEKTSSFKKFDTLNKNCKTDVLIIGAGIAGILTAYFLEQKGIDYILVDKSRICSGVTAKTTAKITFQHSLIYDKIIKHNDIETAQLYLSANRKAFEKYALMCKNIDCNYEIKDNYVYSINSKDKLEKEMLALDKIGYKAEFFENIFLPLNAVGAVCFKNQAQFHPLKFLSAISNNLNIYENTFVNDVEDNTAITDFGKIKAEKIVFATHFPFINRHGAYFMKLYQHRSYVIALENAINLNGMYVDESGTGLSFRNFDKFLLLGGGGHRTGKQGGGWNELREFSNRCFPKAKEAYHWATQDCMSLDSMPYISHYSAKTKDWYVATGFNKWGMTGAMLSAILLCDEISGIANDYSKVFSTSRSMLTPQLFINGAESVCNLLSFSKKRCTHLGCALKWNSAEHSWDCQCHGSRFSERGSILDNPANSNLSK